MISESQKRLFETQGYLVVENVLRGPELAALRGEAEAIAALDPNTQGARPWHELVLYRRPVFRYLLENSSLIQAAAGLIGDDIQLLAMDLLATAPGKGGIGWHRDVTFVCNKTISMNTGLYLQDLDEQVGLLKVVPGTHRSEHVPTPDANGVCDGEVVVRAKAGQAIFFDAALWHTGGGNRSTANRLSVFAYFGRYWVKRMNAHFTQPLPADLAQSTNPMTRQLLGLRLRDGIANYHGDDESYNLRGEPGIDYTTPRETK